MPPVEQPIQGQQQKPRRRIKQRRSGFPFEFVRNVETDQLLLESQLFSQKLQVLTQLQARGASPSRSKQLSEAEKLAFFLNNVTHMDR